MDGKLKAKFKYYGIIWLIAFAAIHLIVFAVPNTKSAGFGGSFWIGYFFILASFVGQFICNALFFRSDTKEKAFLNLPAVSISYGGLVASLAAGALCMTIPYIPLLGGNCGLRPEPCVLRSQRYCGEGGSPIRWRT